MPRVTCPTHGVLQVRVPWAEPGSGFTALFEALVIDWLHEASFAAVARRVGLTWDEVDGIQGRAVDRGLERRKSTEVKRLGVDETSFRKRHKYATIISDIDEVRVLDVLQGRESAPLEAFYNHMPLRHLMSIQVVAMDMCPPFISATANCVPDPHTAIAFDRFQVAKILNDAVNIVRKQEHRELRESGDKRLRCSRLLWLRSPESLDADKLAQLNRLKSRDLQVSRAWAIKETARNLWNFATREAANQGWKKWLGWGQRSQIKPIVEAAGTIRRHLWGIINAIVTKTTSGAVESINARIQKIKKMACGCRDFERFRQAILFHLGGLSLYPTLTPTHTNS